MKAIESLENKLLGGYYTLSSDAEILYCEKKIQNTHYDELNTVVKKHQIPQLSEKNLLITTYFTILSQGILWNTAATIAKRLGNLTIDQLKNDKEVFECVKNETLGIRYRWPENRFKPILNYINQLGDVNKFKEEYLNHPREFRSDLLNVKYINSKTASFIYLMFGGDKDLLTIDRHVIR